MRVEITQKGVHGPDGKPIPVGEEVAVKGDKMPAWLVGKATVIKERKRAAVTNPAQGAVQQDAPQGSAKE